MARVVVLGGGFGGLAAAHELRAVLAGDHEIVLIDREHRFFMGFAKLWDLFGIRPLAEGTGDLQRLREHGIRYVRAGVTRIDAGRRSVETTAGAFAGDALVVALGAADRPDQVARLRGAAHNLYDAGSLTRMRRHLEATTHGRVVVSILGVPPKCPPAPFEATLLLDQWLRDRGRRRHVELVVSTPQPITLPVAGVDASRYVAQRLADRGVGLLAGHAVEELDGERGVVRFANGRELTFDVLLGVPASAAPSVVRDSTLAGPAGWVEPDRTTLRTAFEGIYAVGDCTLVPTANAQLPKAGVFAAGEGIVAARNIAADLVGSAPASFDGRGFCYLELPDRRVATVEGNFFAEPAPDVRLTPPTEAAFAAKQRFEREHLERWLG